MDSADAHRLRPYYKPRDEMSFVATAPMLNSVHPPGGEAASAPVRGANSTPMIALPSGATNRYMTSEADLAELGGAERLSPGAVVKGIAMSAALQFTSNFLAMPFEVGKLLLQVQWVPNEQAWDRMNAPQKSKATPMASDDIDTEDPWSGRSAWQEKSEAEEEEDDADPERYFRNVSAPPLQRRESASRPHGTDGSGYVVRHSLYDEDARPEFVMPIVARGGVWEMIKAVARSKEGWMGLWKGTLTTFVLDVSTNAIQSIVTGFLSLFAPGALNAMPIAFSPQPLTTLGLLTLSHVVTGAVVSPLDLVRTRLVAQSTLPSHRKYAGPLDALRTIFREEGGWRTTYFTPLLFVPTVLDYLFRSVMTLGAPLLLENTFHLDPSAVPVSYALGELLLSTLSLCITLPIETVRRRLQLQYHPPLHSARSAGFGRVRSANTARVGLWTCVETRPAPYTGVLECMYRIVSEETSIDPQLRPAQSGLSVQSLVARGYSSVGGLRNLFRGFGMGFTANLLVFVLTLITGERQTGDGWTEM